MKHSHHVWADSVSFHSCYSSIKPYLPNITSFEESSDERLESRIKYLPNNACKARKNVLFLKTHKTGSSSIQNIFLRYGDYHNLAFVLPGSTNYFGHPEPFNRRMLPLKSPSVEHATLSKSSPYNIFTNHARFNYEEMKSIMPDDTVFVTILRNPVCLFESLVSFYNLAGFYGEKSFASVVDKFFTTSSNTSLNQSVLSSRFYERYGRNQMSFDLGLEETNFDNPKMIMESIRKLDSQFDLVMIADRMDESLILLRHLLCWSQDDVIVFRHNARSLNPACNLSIDLQEKIRTFNIADQLLYDYFLAKLDHQILAVGQTTIEREVFNLQSAIQLIHNECIEELRPTNVTFKLNANAIHNVMLQFKHQKNISETCKKLIMPEFTYLDLLKEKHRKKL